MGNLRSLHTSLNTYLIDNGRWPQVPEELDQSAIPKFWVQALKNYGGTEKVWQCPSLKRRQAESPQDFFEVPDIHYMPGEFDEKPMTPRQWPGMPWVMEIGSMHGDGNMLIRTDGGIRNLNELLRELGDDVSVKLQ